MSKAAALFAIAALLLGSLGCSSEADAPPPPTAERGEVEDGGGGENPHRGEAQTHLNALADAKTAEQERAAVNALANWLNTHGYKLQVEATDEGGYTLACAHFPPVTPWVEHTFLDPANLERLPKHADE